MIRIMSSADFKPFTDGSTWLQMKPGTTDKQNVLLKGFWEYLLRSVLRPFPEADLKRKSRLDLSADQYETGVSRRILMGTFFSTMPWVFL